VRGGVPGIEILGIDGADAVRVSIQSRLQGNVDLCAVSRMARRECTHRNLYASLRGMTHHRSPAAALAMCAAAGVAVLCAPESRAQQPAPAHRERGTLVFENIPLPEAALMARLERYQQSRQASFLDWLADGSLLIATRFGDSEQLHRAAAAGRRARGHLVPARLVGGRRPATGVEIRLDQRELSVPRGCRDRITHGAG